MPHLDAPYAAQKDALRVGRLVRIFVIDLVQELVRAARV